MSKKLDLAGSIAQQWKARKLFKRGEKILVAVSGGVDSMVLLHLLVQLSKDNGWKLSVCHFDHQLRGRSSKADERFVRGIAAGLRLVYFSGKAEVKAFAKRNKLSLEMAARKLRHDFLAKTASKAGAKKIALAHHADDQVELFLLRLLRGSSGAGLAGMKSRNPSPSDPGFTLVRPLLQASKENLLEYAAQNQIRFREDATNASHDIFRNRIRHELIPLLEKNYQPGLKQVLLRQMSILGADAEWVTQQAENWLKRQQSISFNDLAIAIQRKIIHLQLKRLGHASTFDLVESLRLEPDQPVAVGPNVFVVRDKDGRVHNGRQQLSPIEFSRKLVKFELTRPRGVILHEKVRVNWTFKSLIRGTFRAEKTTVNSENFDADKVGDRICLRHWLPGDRFQPLGMGMPVKVQDLFVNRKVPKAQRHKLLVAVSDAEIFWVEGLPPGEQFKLCKGSRYRLQWCWNRL